MKRLGIHARIMISAFLLIIATAFTLDLLGMIITKRFMHSRFKDRISFLARYLALNSEVGVLIGDKTGLKSLALNLLGEEDVARVMILDNHDNQLVDLERPVQGPLSWVETPVVFKRTHDENLLFSAVRSTPFGPQKIEAVDSIGKVRIQFSTHSVDRFLVVITKQFALFSAGLTLIAAVVFFFVSRSIVVDVTRLVETAQQVERGDMDLRAKPGNLPETAQLALAMNAMLDSLERNRDVLKKVNQEVVRQKTLAERGKFSMMIAHEVKNPLSIIKSSLDIMKKDRQIPDDDLMAAYIEDEVRRLNALIEGFLAFARPANPVFRTVDLNALVKDIVGRFEVQYTNCPLRFERRIPAGPCQAMADADLLARAFSNILKNAAEANGEDGAIQVDVRIEGESWIMTIADQGEGIEPELMEKIFEPFFTTRTKGTGLGLAFTRQVIEAHEGTVTARSGETGDGAEFVVRLPIGEVDKLSK